MPKIRQYRLPKMQSILDLSAKWRWLWCLYLGAFTLSAFTPSILWAENIHHENELLSPQGHKVVATTEPKAKVSQLPGVEEEEEDDADDANAVASAAPEASASVFPIRLHSPNPVSAASAAVLSTVGVDKKPVVPELNARNRAPLQVPPPHPQGYGLFMENDHYANDMVQQLLLLGKDRARPIGAAGATVNATIEIGASSLKHNTTQSVRSSTAIVPPRAELEPEHSALADSAATAGSAPSPSSAAQSAPSFSLPQNQEQALNLDQDTPLLDPVTGFNAANYQIYNPKFAIKSWIKDPAFAGFAGYFLQPADYGQAYVLKV